MPAVQLGGASHAMNHQDDLIFLGWFFSFDCSAFKMRPRHILKMHPNHDRPKIVETSRTLQDLAIKYLFGPVQSWWGGPGWAQNMMERFPMWFLAHVRKVQAGTRWVRPVPGARINARRSRMHLQTWRRWQARTAWWQPSATSSQSRRIWWENHWWQFISTNQLRAWFRFLCAPQPMVIRRVSHGALINGENKWGYNGVISPYLNWL